MLPFVDQKKIGSAMINLRKADGTQRYDDGGQVEEEKAEDYGLEDVAQELIDAVHSKDAKAVAMALQAAMGEFMQKEMEEYSSGEEEI